jgi:adenylate cyclase
LPALELYRLKGELLFQQEKQIAKSKKQKPKSPHPQSQLPDPVSTAEACFREAITIAKQQGAKSWGLRAVMSLSRLRQHQGKTKHAHKMLAEIYGWFTEGLDTADLKEAHALLTALS